MKCDERVSCAVSDVLSRKNVMVDRLYFSKCERQKAAAAAEVRRSKDVQGIEQRLLFGTTKDTSSIHSIYSRGLLIHALLMSSP